MDRVIFALTWKGKWTNETKWASIPVDQVDLVINHLDWLEGQDYDEYFHEQAERGIIRVVNQTKNERLYEINVIREDYDELIEWLQSNEINAFEEPCEAYE